MSWSSRTCRVLAAVAAVTAIGSAATVAGPATPAAATPGPPNAPEYWFDDWQVQSLWAQGARGQNITIAEIDTGVNADVPELRGRVLPGIDLGSRGNGQVDREVDSFGHGTAMASIMVARAGLFGIQGLAPDAKILPIAVPLNGTTDAGMPDKVPDAIRYAADHRAKIINLSLGGKRSPAIDTQPCSDEEQEAIYYALQKGSLVIASVGNSGPTKNTIEDPGVCLGVVSVGAVDASGAVAKFSARQPYLTLVAPGVSVPSLSRIAGEAYAGDGTSQAAAITSAVAAMVWSRYPQLTPWGVLGRILATLDHARRDPTPDYGYGVLNGYRAVTADVASNAPDPVYTAVAPFLARQEALARQHLVPPRPVAKPAATLGSYSVGTAPRITPRVQLGLAVASVGLVLLVLLFYSAASNRRRAAKQLRSEAGGAVDPTDYRAQ